MSYAAVVLEPCDVNQFAAGLALALLLGMSGVANAASYAYAGVSVDGAPEEQQSTSAAHAALGNGASAALADISLPAGMLAVATSSGEGGSAAALARGWDGYIVTGLPFATPVSVTVSLRVTGTLDAVQYTFGSPAWAHVIADMHASGAYETWGLSGRPPWLGWSAEDSNADPVQQLVDTTVMLGFTMYAGIPFGISFTLQADTSGEAFADFSHTGTLGFTLPEGAGITSTGGYVASPVPAPGAGTLLATALAVAIFRARPAKAARRR